MSHYVYILSNRPHGAIYIGTARDLWQRMEQHRTGLVSGHAKRYYIKTLVYFECYETTLEAIHRERRLKRWKRSWKDELIETQNPGWIDLTDSIPFDH